MKICENGTIRGTIRDKGQRKKLLRNPAIRAMFERYGVKIEE